MNAEQKQQLIKALAKKMARKIGHNMTEKCLFAAEFMVNEFEELVEAAEKLGSGKSFLASQLQIQKALNNLTREG